MKFISTLGFATNLCFLQSLHFYHPNFPVRICLHLCGNISTLKNFPYLSLKNFFLTRKRRKRKNIPTLFSLSLPEIWYKPATPRLSTVLGRAKEFFVGNGGVFITFSDCSDPTNLEFWWKALSQNELLLISEQSCQNTKVCQIIGYFCKKPMKK